MLDTQAFANSAMPGGKAARRRGWYHGWNVVAACVFAQAAANALPINAFSLFLRIWSRQLHTPISTMQLGIAACSIGCALLSPLVGMLSDKYPARWIFGAGLAAATVFCMGVSSVTHVWQLILLYALVLPIALTFAAIVPSNAVVSRWFVRRLGLALGLSAFGLGIGGILLPPIVAILIPWIGWRTVWRMAAIAIAVIILPASLWILRDRPTERDGLYYVEAAGTNSRHRGPEAVLASASWRDILFRRNFWLLAAAYLPMLALYGGVMQNLAPIATGRGASPQDAGMMLSALSVAQLAATLGGGVLSDRFGARFLLSGFAFTAAAGGTIIAFAHGAAAIGFGALLVGCGGGFWPLLAAATITEFGREGFGRAFGLLTFFLFTIVLAPFATARIEESASSYVPALLAFAGASLLSGLACLWMHKRRRDPR